MLTPSRRSGSSSTVSSPVVPSSPARRTVPVRIETEEAKRKRLAEEEAAKRKEKEAEENAKKEAEEKARREEEERKKKQEEEQKKKQEEERQRQEEEERKRKEAEEKERQRQEEEEKERQRKEAEEKAKRDEEERKRKEEEERAAKEAIAARQRHAKHQDTINRILKFLAGVFGHTDEQGHSSDGSHSPPQVTPRIRQRLMIGDSRLPSSATTKGRHVDIVEVEDDEADLFRDRTKLSDRYATIETIEPIVSFAPRC
ncbi:hypothetical protein NUW54_g14553 [Trametes sanguinea]|uniref:Uncharacterized protein n=1 Tax=Trametes sanguinea TaxID=158606 RepID=A0ACC1MC17_9APHY|nr:hypothetical protein NUW54_g14553 [Trametes sanguinea]